MLIGHFFSILSKTKEEDSIQFEVKLNQKHPVYKGHFPSQPIAPGVCLAQMVKELCENEIGCDLKMKTARSMKFMAVLNPFENENVLVDIKLHAENDTVSVKAHCKNAEKSFFKIDALYLQ